MNPLIKWPGSKRALVEDLLEIAKSAIYGRIYYAPFVGSGALFFALQPTQAVLSDTLCSLMDMYQMVATHPDKVADHLDDLGATYHRGSMGTKETIYYDTRFSFNNARTDPAMAAWFIFLNKAGFNGLWRENKSGEMNVPWGKRERLALPARDRLHEASALLSAADMRCADFEDSLLDAQSGSFIYLDPPYDGAFTGYSADGFDDEDQRRLARLVGCLTDYGVYCMVSNSNTERVRDLYKPYIQHRITANRSIAASAESRGEVQELVITNFDSEGRLI